MQFMRESGKENGFLYNKNNSVNSNVPIDTHMENKIPSWKTRIMELKNRDFDLDQEYEGQKIYDTNEIGFKHPEQEGFLKFYDNGDVRMMSSANTGLTMNKKHGTVNVYGQATNIRSKILNINTLDGGLLINGYALNPQMYLFCNQNFNNESVCDLRLDATIKYWKTDEDNSGYWAEKHIEIEPFIKVNQDLELQSMIQKLMDKTEGTE